jgi:hypothetical protein
MALLFNGKKIEIKIDEINMRDVYSALDYDDLYTVNFHTNDLVYYTLDEFNEEFDDEEEEKDLKTVVNKYFYDNKELIDLRKENQILKTENKKLKAEVESLKNGNETLKKDKKDDKPKSDQRYIYVGTSRDSAKKEHFKVGITNNLSERLRQYNTGRSNGDDRFYFPFFEKVDNATEVEKTINKLLKEKKVSKDSRAEMFKIHYKKLENSIKIIMENIDKSDDDLKKLIDDELSNSYDLRPFAPQEKSIQREIVKEELEVKINEILEKFVEENKFNLTKKEIFEKLDTENCNKHELWHCLKEILNWKDGKSPIRFGDHEFIIKYQ